MALTTDATSAPWIHISGTMAEVLAGLKAQQVSKGKIVTPPQYNGTNFSCIYQR